MNIENMSLERKVGQMLVVGFQGTEIDEHITKAIRDYHIGNIILFLRNFKDINQLYILNKKLQELAIKENGYPLFITIDQEGGMVTRLTKGAPFFPGNMALSAAGDENDAYLNGKYVGEELRALGINFNLAPVLDVNNNPDNPVIGVRSYGEDPKRVAKMGAAYIKGLQEKGIIATGKHFPGHGDTSVDSHLDLCSVNHDRERLEKVELYPFEKAIEIGIKAIMSAHVMFPEYEKEKLPATLSGNVLTKLLRDGLGFKGLIVSDCMEMKAIDKYFHTDKAASMAVKAGTDLIFVSHSFEKQIGLLKNIIQAVRSGDISEEKINDSVKRILKYKEDINIDEFINSSYEGVKKIVCNTEHIKFANKISENSITVLKDNGQLPLSKDENVLCIAAEAVVFTEVEDCLQRLDINNLIIKEFPLYHTEYIKLKPTDDEIDILVKKSKGKDKVVIFTYNANLCMEQVKLVNKIYEINKNVIVIAMRNPYDFNKFNNISSYVMAYEYTPISIRSVIKFLKGEIKGKGKCPVSLNI